MRIIVTLERYTFVHSLNMSVVQEGYFYCQLLINCLEFIKESVKTNGGKNLVELLGEISDTSLFGHVLKQKF